MSNNNLPVCMHKGIKGFNFSQFCVRATHLQFAVGFNYSVAHQSKKYQQAFSIAGVIDRVFLLSSSHCRPIVFLGH